MNFVRARAVTKAPRPKFLVHWVQALTGIGLCGSRPAGGWSTTRRPADCPRCGKLMQTLQATTAGPEHKPIDLADVTMNPGVRWPAGTAVP